MSRSKSYEERTEQLLIPITKEYGVEIYDVEYVKEGNEWYLRAYIDKEDGVNIIDCENVSRALSDALDANEFIDDAYILEVSSPGLGRALKKDKHLEKSIGKEVDIKLYKAIDKQKEFCGLLQSFTTEEIIVLIEDVQRIFKRSDIAVIKLSLDF
ncbi:ribosome maturation factor RimP [Lachnospiraceae bacterium OttesenSCG-928-D06]|nr:ribosome maturation factor RimP [Lachnospiraceae bacterium OttesenSCG-928-D06]